MTDSTMHPFTVADLPSVRPVTFAGHHPWWTVLLGFVGGVALGVVARAWMRLISDEPDFSWSGTIFIVMAFTIFGGAQGVARAVRSRPYERTWSRRTARIVGGIGILPLFVGAGGIMAPTVVGASLAINRVDWPRWARALCVLLAAVPVVTVVWQIWGDWGLSLRTLAGVALFAAIYGVVWDPLESTCRHASLSIL